MKFCGITWTTAETDAIRVENCSTRVSRSSLFAIDKQTINRVLRINGLNNYHDSLIQEFLGDAYIMPGANINLHPQRYKQYFVGRIKAFYNVNYNVHSFKYIMCAFELFQTRIDPNNDVHVFDFSRPFAHKLYMPITYMLAPVIATLYPNIDNELKNIDFKQHTLYSPSFIHIDHKAF